MNDISNPTGFTQLASEGIKNHGCRGKWQKEDPQNICWDVASSYAPFLSRGSSFELKLVLS